MMSIDLDDHDAVAAAAVLPALHVSLELVAVCATWYCSARITIDDDT
jgi:hypothetical protein